jgi:hypothetical protein
MDKTIEITSRERFAAILRDFRAARQIRSYGRLAQFGRSLIAADGRRITYPAWTARPALNIHPRVAF